MLEKLLLIQLQKQPWRFINLVFLKTNFKKHANDTYYLLLRLANAWSQWTGALGERTEAGVTLVGRSLERLAPALEQGGSGLVSMGNQAQELGKVLDEKTAKILEETGNKVRSLQKILKGAVLRHLRTGRRLFLLSAKLCTLLLTPHLL